MEETSNTFRKIHLSFTKNFILTHFFVYLVRESLTITENLLTRELHHHCLVIILNNKVYVIILNVFYRL